MRALRSLALISLLAGAAPVRGQAPPSKPIDRANLDTTCAACSDFYRFANGGWISHNTIPASYSSYGAFRELYDRNQEIVHKILDDARADTKAPAGSNEQKIGTYYGTCMDSAKAEADGAAPLKPTLDAIAAIKTRQDLERAIGSLERRAGLAPFGVFVDQDAKNASQMIAMAGQGGLGMPERDYYLRPDSGSQQLRNAYVDHMRATLQLIGESPQAAKSDADRIMALETKMAQASMPRVEMRDPNAIYHKMTVSDLQKMTPAVDWTRFLADQGAPQRVRDINVMQPGYFRAIDTLLTTVPVDDWKAYLRYHAASNASSALSSAFVNENFRWTQHLTGAKELLPRWKRCAAAADEALGEAIGEVYVKQNFTPEAKARALAMVNNLQEVLRDRISKLTWMSDSTKQRALGKLSAFAKKIGYPDKFRDYSKMVVKPGPYLFNRHAAEDFERQRNWGKLGKPVDRGEWTMTPPEVNAYYSPLLNEIVFPAGILQPPFFDPNADDAVNYGAMGAVIGHEMTHGFDDQGRQFDAKGNLTDWWTPQDAERYNAQAKLVEQQFNGYTVVDSATHVNGKLTLGENIADLGGLKIGYEALEKALAGKPRPLIDGFTPEQRYFMGWALVWRAIYRPEAIKTQVNTDPHSPPEWRVNGPMSNMPEFAKAWGCKAGDAMVRPEDKRAQIW